MPGQLKFQGAGVLRLMDHALAATTHKGDYVTAYGRFGERWLKSEVTKEEYEAWYKTLPAGMQLVKDEGAYLMSNGLPGLPVGSNAVYAERLSNQDFQNNFDATYDHRGDRLDGEKRQRFDSGDHPGRAEAAATESGNQQSEVSYAERLPVWKRLALRG